MSVSHCIFTSLSVSHNKCFFVVELKIYYHMSSFNESVALIYLKQQAIELVKYPCARSWRRSHWPPEGYLMHIIF